MRGLIFYWCYDFEARVFIYIFYNFRYFFVILLPFGILTHCPKINGCIGLKMNFIKSYIKFSEKNICFKWLRHCLLKFLYLIFGFCQCLMLMSQSIAFCNILFIDYEIQTSLLSHWGVTLLI